MGSRPFELFPLLLEEVHGFSFSGISLHRVRLSGALLPGGQVWLGHLTTARRLAQKHHLLSLQRMVARGACGSWPVRNRASGAAGIELH